jgi:thiol-disulfide isomerase/thioredoxin
MPGGRSDEPLDLGVVTATLFDTLDPGEMAPEFVAERLSGGPFRLGELSGKLVLLNFWAAWCVPCHAEIPLFKEIHQEFGDDPRFAMLGIACDNEIESSRLDAEKSGLNWLQVHVRGTYSRVGTDYTVRSLPATFLVAPDGHILAKNLPADELKRAVAAALKNKDLFTAASTAPRQRFQVVKFDAPAVEPKDAEPPAVVVLDDSDPSYDKDQPHNDLLRLLNATGKELRKHGGLNNCETIGGVHGVALDRRRGRIFVREALSKRLLAFDARGERLWQIDNVDAGTLAVDEETGHLWSSGGSSLNEGETIVFDEAGKEVAAFPYRAVDIAYDPTGGAFWLVGYETMKVSRSGEVLVREPVAGWCEVSASVNPADGSVWIAERDHPDVARSRNRVWLRAPDGTVRQSLDLGKVDVFVVACDPKTGDAWVGSINTGVRRVTAAGIVGEPLEFKATQIAISPTTGDVWMNAGDAVLRVDADGKLQARIPFEKPSRQAWLAAF